MSQKLLVSQTVVPFIALHFFPKSSGAQVCTNFSEGWTHIPKIRDHGEPGQSELEQLPSANQQAMS